MTLKAEKREVTGKKVKNLRREGLLPAVVYGPERESLELTLKPDQFRKVFNKKGYSNLFDLEIEGEKKKVKVLFKEVQEDLLTDNYVHVSIYQVDMSKPITTDIPVVITGFSPAVKNNIGLLVVPIDTLQVACLPEKLPSEFSIDVSELKEIGDSITIEALDLPEGVEFTHEVNPAEALVYIAAPQKSLAEEAEEAGEELEEETVEGEVGVEDGETETAEGEASEEETTEGENKEQQ